jgi:O-antigen/teichoic acid export membrane protein
MPNKDIATGLRSLMYNYGGQIILKLLGLLTSVFIIRKFSVIDYGIYNQLLYALPVLSILGACGSPFLLRRFIPESMAKGNLYAVRQMVWISSGVTLVVTSLLVFLAVFFKSSLAELLNSPSLADYLALFGIGVVFATLASLLETAATSLLLQHISNVASVVSSVIQSALFFLVILIGGGILGLVLAFVITNFLWSIFLSLALIRYFNKQVKTSSRSLDLDIKRIGRFTGVSYLNEALYLVFSGVTDVYILSIFTDLHTVGLYTFAITTVKLLTQWAPAVAGRNVIEPLFYQKYTKSQDPGNLNQAFNQVIKIVVLFSIPMFVGMLILGDVIIKLVFGVKYIGSLPVLLVFAFFDLFNSFSWPLGLVTYSTEHVEVLLYSRIFIIYNLITSLLWVQTYGMLGVAFSTGSAVLLKNMFIWYVMKKYVIITLDWMMIGKFILCALGMGFFVLLVKGMVTNLALLILLIVLAGFIYSLLVYVSRTLEGEIGYLWTIVQNYFSSSKSQIKL